MHVPEPCRPSPTRAIDPEGEPSGSMAPGQGAKGGRRRDAARTREAILEAARAIFTAKGFEAVGVREITQAAGFNPSLVNRYFGSKMRLFREAVLDPGFATAGGRTILDRLCALPLMDGEAPARDGEVLTAIVRAAASEEAAAAIGPFLRQHVLDPLAASLEAEEAEARAMLILAFALGVRLVGDVLTAGPSGEAERVRMSRLLQIALAAIAGREMPAQAPQGKEQGGGLG